ARFPAGSARWSRPTGAGACGFRRRFSSRCSGIRAEQRDSRHDLRYSGIRAQREAAYRLSGTPEPGLRRAVADRICGSTRPEPAPEPAPQPRFSPHLVPLLTDSRSGSTSHSAVARIMAVDLGNLLILL